MSTVFKEGSHVNETFASAFKTLVNGLAKANEPVNFCLNMQDGKNFSIYCNYSYAYDHLSFIDELDSEILSYGIAIVIATDYRTVAHDTTIFIVCGDEM